MRILVHLGLPATDSRQLQEVLVANRPLLREAGVLFPQTGYEEAASTTHPIVDNGHSALADAITATRIAARGNYYCNSLIRELLTSGSSTAILSSDLFFHPRRGVEPTRLLEVLRSVGEVQLALYLRRQDLFAEGFYLEMLQWPFRGLARGIHSFVESYLGAEWLDYSARLEPWLDVFGARNVVVKSYDDIVDSGSIIDDLLSQCRVADTGRLQQVDSNFDTPDPGLANVYRAANERIDFSALERATIYNEIAEGAFGRPLERQARGSLIDYPLWSALNDAYAEQNKTLASTLMTGPTDRFRFDSMQAPTRATKQRYTMPQARDVIARRSAPLAPTSAEARQTGTSSERPRVGLTALIMAPLTHVVNWLNFHLNMGYDHIALFIDGPPFHEELRSFPNVTVTNCDEEFWKNMFVVAPRVLDQKLRPIRKLGHDMLVGKGMDWTAGVDGDELMWCDDIHASLSRVDADVDTVVVRPAEAVRHEHMSDVEGFEPRIFKLRPNDDQQHRAAAEAYAEIESLTEFGFIGHTQGKSFVRACVEADFWGSHNVVNTRCPLSAAELSSATLLHFESRPFEDWKLKWTRLLDNTEGRTFFSQRQINQYDRVQQVVDLDDESALRSLYDEWYYMDNERVAALEAVGLVTRIEIPDRTFDGVTMPSGL